MSERQRELILRFLAERSDVNFGGKVHGGMVMKWIDQTGCAAAVTWAGTCCVTAAVEGIQFMRPTLIGDLVSVRARLAHTGTSSMHVVVDVVAHNFKNDDGRWAVKLAIQQFNRRERSCNRTAKSSANLLRRF